MIICISYKYVLRNYGIYKVKVFIKKNVYHLKLFKKSIIIYFYYKKHQTLKGQIFILLNLIFFKLYILQYNRYVLKIYI